MSAAVLQGPRGAGISPVHPAEYRCHQQRPSQLHSLTRRASLRLSPKCCAGWVGASLTHLWEVRVQPANLLYASGYNIFAAPTMNPYPSPLHSSLTHNHFITRQTPRPTSARVPCDINCPTGSHGSPAAGAGGGGAREGCPGCDQGESRGIQVAHRRQG